MMNNKHIINFFDDRRDIAQPGDLQKTLLFCADQFVLIAQQAIKERGIFSVALSGGSTPKAIFQLLASDKYRNKIDWKKVQLFWSDERCVPPDHPDSNYKMAMDAGFNTLPLDSKKIFRVEGEKRDYDQAASEYEKTIDEHVTNGVFDLVMLGMGEDGHTASLFPKTPGLHVEGRLVIANFIPQKDSWRLSFTFDCINNSHHIAIYALGKNKAEMVKKVLTAPYNFDDLPIQRVGTRQHKALWILDNDAAALLRERLIR